MKSNKAFTFIELLVLFTIAVLLIVMITLGLVFCVKQRGVHQVTTDTDIMQESQTLDGKYTITGYRTPGASPNIWILTDNTNHHKYVSLQSSGFTSLTELKESTNSN